MRQLKKPRRFHQAKELPKRLYRPITEGIRKLRNERSELKTQKESDIYANGEAKKTVKRRFLYGIAISEIVGTFITAPLAGSLAQYATGSAYNGIIGTIAGDFFPAMAVAWGSWYALNRKYYSNFKSSLRRAKEFLKDISKFSVVDSLAALTAYAVSAPLSAAYVRLAEHFSDRFAHSFPVSLVSEPLNYALAEAIYLFALIKAARRPLERFTDKYQNYLDKKFGK